MTLLFVVRLGLGTEQVMVLNYRVRVPLKKYVIYIKAISTSKIRFSSGLHSATTRKLSTLISNPSNAGSKA